MRTLSANNYGCRIGLWVPQEAHEGIVRSQYFLLTSLLTYYAHDKVVTGQEPHEYCTCR